MSETNPTPAEQPQFVQLVTQALIARNVKPKCLQCGSIGWANTIVHEAPAVTPIFVSPDVILCAILVCAKCGAKREHVLNVLGLQVQREERRVITPDQIRQEQRPLVVPG